MSTIERREFLAGVAFPFCCTSPPLPAGSAVFEKDRVVVQLVPELRRKSAVFKVVDEARKINLLLIHVERGRYVAIDRTCTHGGAMCTYNPRHHTVQCTSLNHAEYDLKGTLLGGRTHGNLKTYTVEASRASVTIRL